MARQITVLEDFYSRWADQTQPTLLTIGEFLLKLTCGACPEQYDVFRGEIQVGYLRLRHGDFRADAPDCGGETVYEAEPQGDGIFEPEERLPYLSAAVEAIAQWLARPVEPNPIAKGTEL